MAKIELRPDLIAARYEGLTTGPGVAYSFETQEGFPVDGTNPLLRDLSPFSIRIVVPSFWTPRPGVNVNLIGRANTQLSDLQAAADAVRSSFGINSVSGSAVSSPAQLSGLQQVVSAGQVVSGATANTERAVLVDAATAADIVSQVERALQVPPLTLLVNPNSMSISYSNIQNYSDRTRRGFVFQKWGQAQPTISFSGTTGGFIASGDPGVGPGAFAQETTTPSGLQFAAKRDSAAFQNLTSLYLFYRQNGYIYDTIGQSEAHLMIGAIAIDYDQWTYTGHIESFDMTYSEDNPHRVDWSMEFIVDQMFDTAEAPLSVLPLVSPQPNPSYPSRVGQNPRADVTPSNARSGLFNTTGQPAVAQTPLALLGTFGPGGGG